MMGAFGTKDDSDAVALAVGLGLVLLAGKAGASMARKPLIPDASPDADGAALMRRANQPRATLWVAEFSSKVPDDIAMAIARWIGIESSGDPLARSRLNERGLLQAGAQTVKEGGLTQAEWDALADPKTTREEHIRIAVKYLTWLWHRAERYVSDPPQDFIDQVWYAKLYHQWPVDVRDYAMHGPAAPMARQLAAMWANDAKRMHRLRAANVVAFGTPTP